MPSSFYYAACCQVCGETGFRIFYREGFDAVIFCVNDHAWAARSTSAGGTARYVSGSPTMEGVGDVAADVVQSAAGEASGVREASDGDEAVGEGGDVAADVVSAAAAALGGDGVTAVWTREALDDGFYEADLSLRTQHVLQDMLLGQPRHGTLAQDVARYTAAELLRVPGFGRKSLRDVEDWLWRTGELRLASIWPVLRRGAV